MKPPLPNLGCWLVWHPWGTGKVRWPFKEAPKSRGMDAEVTDVSPLILLLHSVLPRPPVAGQHRFLENSGRKGILYQSQHVPDMPCIRPSRQKSACPL